MKLPISVADKLLAIIDEGKSIPASSIGGAVVQKMIDDGVLQKIQSGRTKALLFVRDKNGFKSYLLNQFGIGDLKEYVEKLSSNELTRSDAVNVSGNSKIRSVRTFKGFLVNCYAPIPATLHGKSLVVNPTEGTFSFIYDFEAFVPDASITIVGIENSENFRYVRQQQYLFSDHNPLFVTRYPQSNDLVNWLQLIPNNYIHFGDLDFAGLNIYLNEYERHLGERASFFIPPGVEQLLEKYGNRELYNKQLPFASQITDIRDRKIFVLIAMFHRYKKVLEQEVFIQKL